MCDGADLFCSLFWKLLFVKSGWSALLKAAEKNFEEIVQLLLEYGAKIDIQDRVLIFFLSFWFVFSFLFIVFGVGEEMVAVMIF